MGREMVKEHILGLMEEVCRGMEGWRSMERNGLLQKRKCHWKVGEWRVYRTITPSKTNTHQKYHQVKPHFLVKHHIFWYNLGFPNPPIGNQVRQLILQFKKRSSQC